MHRAAIVAVAAIVNAVVVSMSLRVLHHIIKAAESSSASWYNAVKWFLQNVNRVNRNDRGALPPKAVSTSPVCFLKRKVHVSTGTV